MTTQAPPGEQTVRRPVAAPTLAVEVAVARRAFRQLRTAAVVLAVTFGVVALSSALTYVGSFPTEVARRNLASSLSGDAGFSVVFGQVNAIDTVGGYTAYKCYVFLTTIGAIWAALAATRLLRGEEDTGRWQVVLAGATTPKRATMATVTALAGAIAVIFVGLTAFTLMAGAKQGVGFGPGGSAMFALSMVLAPVVFAAVGALFSQLSRTRRLATALSLVAFAIAFVVRMVADAGTGSHWLLWATPLGWVELMRPLTADDPWPLLPAVVLTGALLWAAVRLATHRDAGNGVLATSETAELRPFGLRSPLGLTARLNIPVLAAWCTGVALLSFVFGMVTKSAATGLARSPSAGTTLDKLGAHGGGAAQYLGVVFLLTGAVLALVPAGQVGAARDEEASGRLALVLAGATSPRAWIIGRLALAAGSVAVAGGLAGVFAWAGAASQGAHVGFGRALLAGANIVPAALLALAVGAVALAVVPRWAGTVVYVVVGGSLIVDLLGSLVAGLTWLTRASLFHYVALAPARDPDWVALAVTSAVALVLAAAAVVIFERRDLQID